MGEQREPRLSVVFTPEVVASVTCHHCEAAPCLAVCPVNAISRTNNRISVNEQTCIGCKLCACVCPFGAIHASGTSLSGVAGRHENTDQMPAGTSSMLKWEIGVPTCAVKCDLCEYDPEHGPHCVSVCPTKALSYVKAFDLTATAMNKRKEEILVQSANTAPVSTIELTENVLIDKRYTGAKDDKTEVK